MFCALLGDSVEVEGSVLHWIEVVQYVLDTVQIFEICATLELSV